MDQDGETPLREAVRYGNVEVAMLLLDHNANVNAQNRRGESPLDVAIFNHYGRVEAVLQDHGGVTTYRPDAAQ